MTHTLTGNDIAAAIFGVEEAIAVYKKRGRSRMVSEELRRLEAARAKLQAIFDYAYPCTVPDDAGKEAIMTENGFVTRQTRAACFAISEAPQPKKKERARV